MLEDVKKDATVRMQKCVTAFKEQLKKLRTGRAHTSLIEHIKVDYYGSEMPLNQVANIAAEDARVYDPRSIGVRSVSAAITLIRDKLQPSTSATICAVMVSEPCPISAAPVYTTTPPSRSILMLTVE